MSYRIALSMFEGPFDLLLFLIRKNEIDIYDIPISELINQYMEYIEVLREIDLNNAAEFIDMAATLMRIKAKLLLPSAVYDPEEGEEEDPRAELVQQLLAYRQFKEAGEELQEFEEKRHRRYERGFYAEKEVLPEKPFVEAEAFLEDITLFDLLIAFKRALDNMPKITRHVVESYEVTLEEQKQFIFSRLRRKKRLKFSELLKDIKERIVALVTFLAILEMTKAGELSIQQSEMYGEITMAVKGGG
jgi:segregation and condensation protein A